MPKPNEWNEWGVSYSTIRFVEQALQGHTAVESFKRESDIVFRIERTGERGPVVAVVINRYVIGQADVVRVLADFPDVQMVVAHGNWCGYTREAEEHGRQHGVSVFEMSEFFGALNYHDFLDYAKRDADGEPHYSYKKTAS